VRTHGNRVAQAPGPPTRASRDGVEAPPPVSSLLILSLHSRGRLCHTTL
jgi:hypothetical protein